MTHADRIKRLWKLAPPPMCFRFADSPHLPLQPSKQRRPRPWRAHHHFSSLGSQGLDRTSQFTNLRQKHRNAMPLHQRLPRRLTPKRLTPAPIPLCRNKKKLPHFFAFSGPHFIFPSSGAKKPLHAFSGQNQFARRIISIGWICGVVRFPKPEKIAVSRQHPPEAWHGFSPPSHKTAHQDIP